MCSLSTLGDNEYSRNDSTRSSISQMYNNLHTHTLSLSLSLLWECFNLHVISYKQTSSYRDNAVPERVALLVAMRTV